jgi:tetratricopeptide (TPR) repeat protein
MRNIKLYSFLFVLIVFFLGCRSKKEVVGDSVKIDENIKETQYYKLFTDATKNALFGNYQSAVPLYKACIEMFPERAAPYYQLSSIFIRNQDGASAVKFAEESYRIDSSNIWYAVNLANIYQFLGFLDSAANMYVKILEKQPDDEMRYNLAMIYSQLGKYTYAEELLQKIDERNPGSKEIILMRHNIFNEQRNYDSAIYQLELLTKYFPEDINNYGILAEYLSEVGRREYARKVYCNLLKLDSTNGLSMISFAEFYKSEGLLDSCFYYYQKAFLNSDLGYSEKIDLVVNQIANKDFLKVYSDRLLYLLNTIKKSQRDFSYYAVCADIYLNTERYEQAKTFLDSAVIYEKNNYLLWEQALLVNSFLGNDSDVIDLAYKSLIFFKEKPAIYMFKAYAEKNTNQIDSCIKDALIVETLKPNKKLLIQSYILLAESFREKGLNDISDSYFEKVLIIDPFNLPIRNNYAYYLALRGKNLQRAKELSKLTIEKEPDNATYLDTYGWVMFKTGKVNEAKDFIERAIRKGGFNNAEVIQHYGDIMNALNRCKEAIEAYERVVEIDSTYILDKKIEVLKKKCQ